MEARKVSYSRPGRIISWARVASAAAMDKSSLAVVASEGDTGLARSYQGESRAVNGAKSVAVSCHMAT